MTSLNELREHGQMTWSEPEQGWIGTPGNVLDALAADGFNECKREMTSSRRDCRPVGGVWQGVNPLTNSVASLIWVARPAAQPATLFIEIDGEALASCGPEGQGSHLPGSSVTPRYPGPLDDQPMPAWSMKA